MNTLEQGQSSLHVADIDENMHESSSIESRSQPESNEDVLYHNIMPYSDSAQINPPTRDVKLPLYLYAAASFEGCDEQMLPAAFGAFEKDLHSSPTYLGLMSWAQSVAVAITMPAWGWAADRYNRKSILMWGTFSWGILNVLMACTQTYYQLITLRFLIGLSLSTLSPIAQTIITEATKPNMRAAGFGLLQFFVCMGRFVGTILMTSLSNETVLSYRGWRFCFFVIGILNFMMFLVISFYMPAFKRLKTSAAESASKSANKAGLIIIGIEGIVSQIPWSAFGFNVLFFQYCGLGNWRTSVVTGCLALGSGLAGFLGGYLGIVLCPRYGSRALPVIGILSMILRIPLILATYLWISPEEANFLPFCFIFGFIGLFSFSGYAVNRPLLGAYAPKNRNALVFSLQQTLEGIFSNTLGAPLVGFIAERILGYKEAYLDPQEVSAELRRINVNALRGALVLLTSFPFIICAICYALLLVLDTRPMTKVGSKRLRTDEENHPNL